MDLLSGTGLLLTAGILGVTHGVEPDHVAGITALTGEAGDSTLSAIVGACFALGHVALVVCWIAIAVVFLDVTAFPAVLEQLGLIVVGVVLASLSLALGWSGTRRLLHTHEHEHGGDRHAHVHLHLPFVTEADHGHVDGGHEHEHGLRRYLTVGTVGALFTLSPPVSMIAFITVVLSDAGGGLVGLAVLVYGLAIAGTMAVVGAGAGTLFGLTRARGERYHGALEVVAAAIVLAVAATLLLDVVPQFLAAPV
jgi:nickel/cobalt exporter